MNVNEFLEIKKRFEYAPEKDTMVVFWREDIVSLIDEVENLHKEIYTLKERRFKAACAAVTGILASGNTGLSRQITVEAVMVADALLKRLKESGDE